MSINKKQPEEELLLWGLQLFPKEKVRPQQLNAQIRLGLVGLEALAVQLEQQDQNFSVLMTFCLN
jgi:hypothetical protein